MKTSRRTEVKALERLDESNEVALEQHFFLPAETLLPSTRLHELRPR